MTLDCMGECREAPKNPSKKVKSFTITAFHHNVHAQNARAVTNILLFDSIFRRFVPRTGQTIMELRGVEIHSKTRSAVLVPALAVVEKGSLEG